MFDPLADIVDFHKKFGLTYEGKPRSLPADLLEFRIKFLQEEIEEYKLSSSYLKNMLQDGSVNERGVAQLLEEQLDALVDLMYVLLGTAYLQGYGNVFREAWRRVHAANMQKVRAQHESESKRGSTHDVIKPPGWSPPSHTDLVTDHAHRYR